MSLNLTNCPKCGKLMARNLRNMCPGCHQDIELQYEKCLKYLRDNRKASMSELSEATGVSTAQITKFIREGRISVAEAANLSYACEVCGGPIYEGHLCDPCRQRLVKDVNGMKEDEQRRAQQTRSTGYLKDK
jgi:flagellar operon protein (TIGR03826 family)